MFPVTVVFPKRFRSAACQVDELPEINAVLISHNHYDHLDANSVRTLNGRFGPRLRWYVPLGLKSWMRDMSCDNVVELDWWEEDVIPDVPDVLWGGFCVIGRRRRFYFPGDTGYVGVMFKQIGQKYGPFDLAALPIGAYEPRDFMSCQHCDPEEAVLIHKDLRARQSVGIHWGTFTLANEFYVKPPQKLAEALRKHNLTKKDFFTMNLGETRLVADECSEVD
ncbi:hypothetical protein NP493_212g03042 [Ridgeia piscesae]|uniref:Metallo-beta-lactamase domain-containing protein n=1 Tax=Ridgeia piscesae TaxID=27915 RepID=A0AAD9P0Z0_RIDPI|nr:hypothetical protein NP493_212g03042 [Ridgeia piscesae]